MACEKIRPMLSAYLDEVLPAEENRLVEAHLAGCETCRETLEHLRKVREAVGSLDPVMAPPGFKEAFMKRFEPGAAVHPPLIKRLVRPLSLAASFLIVALTAYMLYRFTGVDGMPPKAEHPSGDVAMHKKALDGAWNKNEVRGSRTGRSREMGDKNAEAVSLEREGSVRVLEKEKKLEGDDLVAMQALEFFKKLGVEESVDDRVTNKAGKALLEPNDALKEESAAKGAWPRPGLIEMDDGIDTLVVMAGHEWSPPEALLDQVQKSRGFLAERPGPKGPGTSLPQESKGPPPASESLEGDQKKDTVWEYAWFEGEPAELSRLLTELAASRPDRLVGVRKLRNAPWGSGEDAHLARVQAGMEDRLKQGPESTVVLWEREPEKRPEKRIELKDKVAAREGGDGFTEFNTGRGRKSQVAGDLIDGFAAETESLKRLRKILIEAEERAALREDRDEGDSTALEKIRKKVKRRRILLIFPKKGKKTGK